MRILTLMVAISAVMCMASVADAQHGNRNRSLTLYSGLNYSGQSVTIRSDVVNFQTINFNDRAQSIRIEGAGSWTLCHHANFQGVCHQFTNDVANLNPFQLAGNISSARMEYDAGPGRPGRPGRPGNVDRPRNGIILFDGPRYRGESVHIYNDNLNLMGRNFNDRAQSVLIARGEAWEFCEHANYRGRCSALDGDTPGLRTINLGNQLSSVRRVYDSGRPGGGYPGSGYGDGSLTLYAGPNFTGQSINIDRETYNLTRQGWNDRAMSLVVEGNGSWTICEDANFGSPCRTVSGRVRNLNAYGLGNRVTSLRPEAYVDPGYNGPGGNYGPDGTLTLFAGPNFTGPSIVIDRETYNLTRQGWNDRAMSAIVNGYGDWTVCEDSNFGSPCRTISGRVRNLNAYGLGNRISSVRPEGGGYYGPKSDAWR
ncbi:beta/gamma crystallin-related protein [Hyphobacterium sp.]|uniref:beta/gamma crystallin-related protein n=1 Tax=Hyphobacterium sp. TaxID=2004662 RepID=UPI003B51A373